MCVSAQMSLVRHLRVHACQIMLLDYFNTIRYSIHIAVVCFVGTKMLVGFHLCRCRSSCLCGTVAKGFAEALQTTEDVQVQLSCQLCQLHPHHTVPPCNSLFTLSKHTERRLNLFQCYSLTYTYDATVKTHTLRRDFSLRR